MTEESDAFLCAGLSGKPVRVGRDPPCWLRMFQLILGLKIILCCLPAFQVMKFTTHSIFCLLVLCWAAAARDAAGGEPGAEGQ